MGRGRQHKWVGEGDGPVLGASHVHLCGGRGEGAVEEEPRPEGVPRMVMAEMKEQAREMVVGTSLVMEVMRVYLFPYKSLHL